MMRKIWEFSQAVIQCVRSSYCIDNLFIIYLFLKRNSILNGNYAGTFDISCSMFSNVISLVLRDGDTDSKVKLIQHSVSYGQKTCRSKGVSLTIKML